MEQDKVSVCRSRSQLEFSAQPARRFPGDFPFSVGGGSFPGFFPFNFTFLSQIIATVQGTVDEIMVSTFPVVTVSPRILVEPLSISIVSLMLMHWTLVVHWQWNQAMES